MLCVCRANGRDASMHRDTRPAPRAVSRPIELADRQTWKYINIRISSDIRRARPNNVFYSSPRPHIVRTSGPVADPSPMRVTARRGTRLFRRPFAKSVQARCYFTIGRRLQTTRSRYLAIFMFTRRPSKSQSAVSGSKISFR